MDLRSESTTEPTTESLAEADIKEGVGDRVKEEQEERAKASVTTILPSPREQERGDSGHR